MLKLIYVRNEETKMIVEECYINFITDNPKSLLLWEGMVHDRLCYLSVSDLAPLPMMI